MEMAQSISAGSLSWIEILSQSVADEIESQDRESDGYTGEDQSVWGGLQR